MRTPLILAGVEAVKLVEMVERYAALLLMERFNDMTTEIGRQLLAQVVQLKKSVGATEFPTEQEQRANNGSTTEIIMSLFDDRERDLLAVQDIIESTGLGQSKIATALSRLVQRGRLTRVEQGVYTRQL